MLDNRIGLFPDGTTAADALDDIVDGFVDAGHVTMTPTEALIFAATLADIRREVAQMEMRLGIAVHRIAWAPANDVGYGGERGMS